MALTTRVLERHWMARAASVRPVSRRQPRAGTAEEVDPAKIMMVVLVLLEFAACIFSALLAYVARYGVGPLPPHYWLITFVAGFLFTQLSFALAAYNPAQLRERAPHHGRLVIAWSLTMLGVVSIIYFGKYADELSRLWILLWSASGLSLLLVQRFSLHAAFSRLAASARFATNVVVLGTPRVTERLARRLAADREHQFSIVGVVTAHWSRFGTEDVVEAANEILSIARAVRVDEIIIIASRPAKRAIAAILERLAPLAATVRVCRAGALDLDSDGPVTMLAGIPMAGVEHRPLSKVAQGVKRALDLTLTCLMLAVLFPLFIGIAAAIKLDSPGPVLFRQTRYGFNGNRIQVYKFRSMRADRCSDDGAEQARRNDLRLTRVGRFIRRTSLDELPQLFNVLRGDMSLVGPRPHPVGLDERFAGIVDGYLARHRVLPGITGWAQVSGLRGETSTVERMQLRVKYDLEYIENWSAFLDIRILLKTAFVFLFDRNAY